jgi:acetylornithine deacetylase/succinyl-diaminopimelate desuccinylase-like protein
MNFQRIDAYIDKNLDASLAELARLVAQPSVSARHEGLAECADLVEALFKERHFQVQRFENNGAPILVAERRGRSDKTVLFYNHYAFVEDTPI